MASSQDTIAAKVRAQPRKDAAKKLMDTGIVSRVDADEAANVKKADTCDPLGHLPVLLVGERVLVTRGMGLGVRF